MPAFTDVILTRVAPAPPAPALPRPKGPSLLSRLAWAAIRLTLPVTGPDGRRGGNIQTFTGGRFWPMDPRAEDVVLEDVAHHLSMKARFSGAVEDFLSVAQHSVQLSHVVPGGPAVQYAALHHDDPEYVLPDIPTPVKPYVPGWKAIEDANERAIVLGAFRVDPDLLRLVKPYDKRIVGDEAAALLRPARVPWTVRPVPLGIEVKSWSPAEAEARYLARHRELAAVLGL